jgi:hypothetical protein
VAAVAEEAEPAPTHQTAASWSTSSDQAAQAPIAVNWCVLPSLRAATTHGTKCAWRLPRSSVRAAVPFKRVASSRTRLRLATTALSAKPSVPCKDLSTAAKSRGTKRASRLRLLQRRNAVRPLPALACNHTRTRTAETAPAAKRSVPSTRAAVTSSGTKHALSGPHASASPAETSMHRVAASHMTPPTAMTPCAAKLCAA